MRLIHFIPLVLLNCAQAAEFGNLRLSGGVDFFARDRERAGFDEVTGNDTRKSVNLKHQSTHAFVGVSYGGIEEKIGADFRFYATSDLSNAGSPDHEMNFWAVKSPYRQVPTTSSCPGPYARECTKTGWGVSTALLRFRFDDTLILRAGRIQPQAPGALGVNWSFEPGYYRGIESQFNYMNWKFGAIVADRYHAPWFEEEYRFQDSLGNDAGNAYSVGAQGDLGNGYKIDIAYAGLSHDSRKVGHVKVRRATENLSLALMVFQANDSDLYADPTRQFVLQTIYTNSPYTLRLESTYSLANRKDRTKIGAFAYRLTQRFAGSAGAYGVWWNNRSDFNHDQETAAFLSLERSFGDYSWPGLKIGASFAAGRAEPRWDGINPLRESSMSLFASYKIQTGQFRNALFSIHGTRYKNKTKEASWNPYTNLFQDETDLKIAISFPFDIN